MAEFALFIGCIYLATGFVLAFGTAIEALDQDDPVPFWMILVTVFLWLPALVEGMNRDELD